MRIIKWLSPLAGIAAEIVIHIMPSSFHDDMDGVALPVCVDNVAAGQIVKILAVVRVRPQAYRAVCECALTPVDVLLRKH